MINSWVVTLPPLLVLGIALWSRNVILSFIVGIISAALITASLNPLAASNIAWYQTIETLSDSDNLFLYSFLFLMGIIVSLLSYTGAATAFGDKITSRLTNARTAEHSTMFLSCLLFLDDYLNSLTVGYVMHPLTDKFKIPRVKLAFLIHSMTAPLAIIIPVSSWLGWIIKQMELSGISIEPSENPVIVGDPLFVYLKTIPYIFFSFITIAITWFVVQKRIAIGPMAHHEKEAENTGNLFGGKTPLAHALEHNNSDAQGTIIDFIFPIITLVASTVIGVLYQSGFWLFGGTRSLVQALQHTNIFPVLFFACLVTLGLSIPLFLYHRKMTTRDIGPIVNKGIKLMYLSVVMVFCAGVFASLLREDLQTGNYIAQVLMGDFNIHLLPILLFIVSSIIALCTGSSWGTLAIMTPIAVPMLLNLLQLQTPTTLDGLCLLFPCLGAVFSGAVAGDNLSPISETTIMAKTSSGCYLMDHVYTQIPYGAVAVFASGVSFFIAGYLPCEWYWFNAFVGLAVGLGVSFVGLILLNKNK